MGCRKEGMVTGSEKRNRRSFLGMLAARSGCGVGLAAAHGCRRPGQRLPLTDQDQFDAGSRSRDLVERASSLGREYTAEYGNCSQATIAALQDAIEFVPRSGEIFRAGTCLHGGATATGNANCGGFTGAGIVIGHLCGRERGRASDREAARLSSRLIRKVADQFEQMYGGVICKDVREKAGKNCREVVAHAAGWAAGAILQQFAKDRLDFPRK
jgi:hypothetical protein